MVVENNVAISSKQVVAGKPVANNNAIKTAPMQQDSVEISTKKRKETSKAKVLLAFAGALLLAGGLGAITHKFITTRPSYIKKQMSDTLGRSLTNDEIAKIDKKCKKTYTGWDFFDDIITGLIFI